MVALAMLWGCSFLFIYQALLVFTPFTVVLARVGLSAPVLLIAVFVTRTRIPSDLSTWGHLMVMGVLNNILPFALIVYAQGHISTGLASILNGATPIFAILCAHFLVVGERASAQKLLAVLIGFLGVAVMLGDRALANDSSGQILGMLAMLGACACYSLAGIWGRKLSGHSALANSFGMLSCSTLVLLPVWLIFDGTFPDMVTVPLGSIASVVALAVGGTAFAYILYFQLLVRIGSTNVMLVTFLIPIVAIILGALVLDERLATSAFVGMLMIFLSLAAIDGRVIKALRPKRNA